MTAEQARPTQSPGQTCSTVLSRLATLAVLLILIITAVGCAAIGGIFKAGVWVGLIVAALVIVIVLFLVRRVPR
jgi:membrane protein YdbS with pleckstrin-like domain